MSIVYICSQCKGSGFIEKKIWILTKKASCRLCNGTGKRVYKKERIVK